MKKFAFLLFVVGSLSACKQGGNQAQGPTQETKLAQVVCYKNGQVVLKDSVSYDKNSGANPRNVVLDSDQKDVSFDHCEYL